MPHLTLEYSDNLPETPDFGALFARLHAGLVEHGPFQLSQIKSRAIPCNQFLIGTGLPESIFVHLTVAILDGRPSAQRKQIGEHLLAVLREAFAPSWKNRPCDITVEIREMSRETYCKAMNAAAQSAAARKA